MCLWSCGYRASDIWAFGVCLWEALTGQRLFQSSDAADTLAAVLRADPEWEALPSSLPRPLRRLLRRCLQREPRERLRDIADAALELEDARKSPTDTDPAATKVASGGPLLRFLPWAVAVATTVIAAWSLLSGPSGETDPARTTRFSIDLPIGTDFSDDNPNNVVAISPDGSTVVWSGKAGEHARKYR